MATTMFRVFRYQPDSGETESYHQDFTLEHEAKTTVLDALLQLQNEQDGTIAVRYSCRSAICGSCACKVNGKTVLACMTQVEEAKADSGVEMVQIDPIGNFPPIKDLVVDMTTFWDKFKAVKPFLIPDGPAPEKERLVPKAAMEKIARESACILCAACYSECNSLAADPEFVGPAAFAWGYRFAADERDSQRKNRAKLYSGEHGVWDCTRCMFCNERCPKGVDPRDAIEKLGAIAFQEKVTSDKGARHAKAFLISMRTGGKLNEILIAPYTDPIGSSFNAPLALRMASKGKLPKSPLTHKVKNADQVKKLIKNVKETI